jgi:uncharacterized delta-60 repeat protein
MARWTRTAAVATAAATLLGQLAGQAPARAATGGLARSFGAAGYVATRLGATTSPGVDMAKALVQPDGKLVVAGSVDGHPVAARFNADGSPDTAFGSGGVARVSSVANFTTGSADLGAGGRILVAGAIGVTTTDVVAFTSAGALDPAFGSGGVATVSSLNARRLVVQGDGRILLAGSNGSAGALSRLTAAGGLDPSFGSGGTATNSSVVEFEAVALDGAKPVVGGTKSGTASTVQAVVARYTSTGALDTSFASSGQTSFATMPSFVADLAVAGGNYALLVGSDQKTMLAEYDTAGALAAGFGSSGVATVPVDGQLGLAVDGAGRLVVVGDDNRLSISGRYEAVAARLNSDGSADEGFGCNGVSYFSWGNLFSTAHGAVALSDSSLILTGATAGFEGDQAELVLAKVQGADAATEGYRMMTPEGDTEAFGVAAPCRTGIGIPFVHVPVDIASVPVGQGDWEAASDGGVFSFGSARFFGSMGGKPLNAPIVGIAAAPDGQGYWLVASDGGVFAFGSARFFGSMGGKPLNAAVLGIAAAPDGQGYWLVAADGGVFSFGSAHFFGSTGGRALNAPVMNMTAAPDGHGYWLAARDGGVFAYGTAPFKGSMGGRLLNAPVVDMGAPHDGGGYWLLGQDGGVFAFGTAPFLGSMGARPQRGPWVALSEV